jgi:hypothetical protein
LIYSKTFVGYRLVANRARPCWRLFLQLQERVRIEALVVRADSRPARCADSQRRDGVLERHDHGIEFDVGIVGLLRHLVQDRLPSYDVALFYPLSQFLNRKLPHHVDEEVVLLRFCKWVFTGG